MDNNTNLTAAATRVVQWLVSNYCDSAVVCKKGGVHLDGKYIGLTEAVLALSDDDFDQLMVNVTGI